MLIIRITENKDGSKAYKYAMINAMEGPYTTEALVRMLSQRYFVERSFQEAGMSQYNARGESCRASIIIWL